MNTHFYKYLFLISFLCSLFFIRIDDYVTVFGEITFFNHPSYILKNKSEGYIDIVYKNENQFVKKGELILMLDKKQYLANLRSFNASLNDFQEQKNINNETIRSIRSEIDLIQQKIDSYKVLVEEGFFSEKYLNDLYVKLENSFQKEHAVRSELSNILSSLVDLQNKIFILNNSLLDLEIRSPIDGVISKLNFDKYQQYVPKNSDVVEINQQTNNSYEFNLIVNPVDLKYFNDGDNIEIYLIEDLDRINQTFKANIININYGLKNNDNGNFFLVKGEINSDEIPNLIDLAVGSKLKTHIQKGKVSLFYFLFGSVFEKFI